MSASSSVSARPTSEETVLALIGLAWTIGWLWDRPLVGCLVGGLSAVGLAMSQRRARLAAAFVLGSALVASALGVPAENPATLLPAAIAVHGLGRWAGPRAAFVGLGAFLAALVWSEGLSLPTLVFASVLYGCFWGFGRLVAVKSAQAVGARQRAVQVGAQDPRAVADAVVAEERTRLAADIARVVGAAVEAMVTDAEQAAAELDPAAIERIRARGAAAVAELRRMLGLLRQQPERTASAPPARPRRGWPPYALTAGVLVIGAADVLTREPRPPVAVLALLGLVPLVLLLRGARLAVALLLTTGAIGLVGLIAPAPIGPGAILVLVLLSWSTGVDGRRSVWAAWLASVLVSAAVATIGDPDNAAMQVVLTVLPAWAGHAWSGSDREQRSAQAATARAQSALDQAVAEAVRTERLRVARELHDVTSHALGVMVLQAGAAAAQRVSDPARARMSLVVIGETGARALADLARLVVLIDGGALGIITDEEPPGLPDRLAALADRVRQAGVDVQLRIETAPTDPEVAQVCYRIVQEALTNTLRHALGSSVSVLVDGRGGCRLSVIDDGGRGPLSEVGGTGFGLVGVAERVGTLGGQLTAGPEPGGGWAVRASIPEDARPRERASAQEAT